MRILMLGWELPPVYAGGVGVVCDELAKELTKKNVDITFIMPSGPKGMKNNHIDKLLIANNLCKDANIKIKQVDSLLSVYQSSEEYDEAYQNYIRESQGEMGNLYGKNIIEEVYRFAAKVALLVRDEEFDVIHAHDWTTFPAAILAKQITQKPLVVHMHITEFNKSGGLHASPQIYAIEKEGMQKADVVIAISNLVKNLCVDKYHIPDYKIKIVHNAATSMNDGLFYKAPLNKNEKIVLYMGRVTLQKGPEYFVRSAKLVLEHNPDVTFVVGGTGDMLPKMIELAAQLGISNKFVFHGFYTRKEAEKLFSMADVYVMPSVSEPFGVVGYEAMRKKTPTIISKQSGMSEVASHCLKVDFWDTREMAAKILALLQYPALNGAMAQNGHIEAKNATWEKPAQKCIHIYESLCS